MRSFSPGLSARAGAGAVNLPDDWDAASVRRADTGHEFSLRPSLSEFLPALAGAWGGVSMAGASWIAALRGDAWLGVDPVGAAIAVAALLVALCLLAAGLCPRMRAVGVLLAVGVLAGSLAGHVEVGSVCANRAALAERAVSSYTFRIESDVCPTQRGGCRFEARTTDGAAGSQRVWVEYEGESARRLLDAGVGLGSEVRLVGRWRALEADDEFDASLIARGFASRVAALSLQKVAFQGGVAGSIRAVRLQAIRAIDPFSSEERALGAGVVCGMQAALSSFEVNDAFSDLGLSHLVAVSGSHLAVIAALMGVVLRRVRARPCARLVSVTVLLAAYVVFTGFQPSAVRSWVMAVLALSGAALGRRSHVVSAVGAAAFAMLLADPTLAADLGFTLSVLSVLGLSVFAGYAGSWVRCMAPRHLPRAVSDGVALTLVAQTFTAPVAIPTFGTVPLLSVPANVAVGPLVSGLLLVGLPCFALAWFGAGASDAILAPCDMLAHAACRAAHALCGLPVVAVSVEASAVAAAVALAICSAALYILWPRPSRRAGVAVALVATLLVAVPWLWGRWCAPARVVVLDVGQGDAILIQDGPHALLVDTGPDDAVCYALARKHVSHLDAVVLTHTDADHAGGLDDLDGRVSVGRVVVARGVAQVVGSPDSELGRAIEGLADAPPREVGCGDRLSVGGFVLEFVWPEHPVAGGENEDSLVAVARYGDAAAGATTLSVLLTGDAEAHIVGALAACGTIGRVDVLKVGHHGSAASTTAEMLDALDPMVAVASAGEGNRYGHPAPTCVRVVEESGAVFLCTASLGDVEVRPGREGVEVSCSSAP